MTKTLWDPIVEESKLHETFKKMRNQRASMAARWMLDDVYQSFVDPDGNFLEQFQTSGFDARFFELYLHAYFSRSGFAVDRRYDRPDFLVTKDNLTVAIESTTVNESKTGPMVGGKPLHEMSEEESREYVKNELPIRFGSPLTSKLAKKYWELPQCTNMPLVFAIADFHAELAMLFPDTALSSYLYGLDHKAEWGELYDLVIKADKVEKHEARGKSIPSNFFELPGANNISAVLFTNNGTSSKFSRMGYQHGIGNDELVIWRMGTLHNPLREAMDSTFFCYDMSTPPILEAWGHGVVIIHNPKAKFPIPLHWFPDAVDAYLNNGVFQTDHAGWYVFASMTQVIHLEDKSAIEIVRKVRRPTIMVKATTRQRYVEFGGPIPPASQEEHGWYHEPTFSFLAVVTRDKASNAWAYGISAVNREFVYKTFHVEQGLTSRREAVQRMQQAIAALVEKPKRVVV